MKKNLKQGVKFDSDKIRLDLVPVIGTLLEGDVYTIGGIKYDAHNWRKGIAWSRIIAAMKRHIAWFEAGESFDPEDAQHHLASVKWCANTLMEFELTHKEFDDRYIPFPPEKLRELLSNMRNPNVKKKSTKKTIKRPRNKKKRL